MTVARAPLFAGLRTFAGGVASATRAVDDTDRGGLAGDVAVTALALEVARRVLIAGFEAAATGRAVEVALRTAIAIVEAVTTSAGVVARRVLVAVELTPSTAAVEGAVGFIQTFDLAPAFGTIDLAGLRVAMAVARTDVGFSLSSFDVVGAASESEPDQQDQSKREPRDQTIDDHDYLHESDDSSSLSCGARLTKNWPRSVSSLRGEAAVFDELDTLVVFGRLLEHHANAWARCLELLYVPLEGYDLAHSHAAREGPGGDGHGDVQLHDLSELLGLISVSARPSRILTRSGFYSEKAVYFYSMTELVTSMGVSPWLEICG